MNGVVRIEQLRRMIDHHGWAVIGVFPTTPTDGAPFSYTVGLTDRGLPELAVYGLQPRAAGGVLNTVARHAIDGGELAPGQRITGLLAGGLPLTVIEMTDTTDMTSVRELYGAVLAAQQVIWPDADGRMPWENWNLGTRQPLKGSQPA
ncbi:DUF4262 domain-containing protein [Mycolicibacterium nivoides]|uniref:DUF4262 domain-containing protein n=1 Tax=Mycolicibacterium nivoides TaxID=2487344 RepID=A0ABW9LJX1_9MYCO